MLEIRGLAVARSIGRSLGNFPWFTRIALVLQTAVIVALSGWIYHEYVNKPYLQVYLVSLLQGKGSTLAVLGLGGLLGTALVGILLKDGNLLGEIEHLSEKFEAQTPVIKAAPARTAPMPVLEIVDNRPRDEVGELHDSLRRWKDHHQE